MEKKNSGGMNVGTSSILVTFVLLCLVTFAALAYMSARSDYKLSQQTADRTAAYYDANRVAEIYMANVEGQLAKLANNCADETEYFDKIKDVFSDNDFLTVSESDGKISINYSVRVTEAQNLQVSLLAHYPDEKNGMLILIDKWQAQTNNEYVDSLKESPFGGGTGLMF